MRVLRSGVLCLLLAVIATAALVHADAAPLQTTEIGQGPTIVFVHGLGGSRTDWLPTVKRLRERFHTVLVDLPGHGGVALPEPFSLESGAEQIDAILARQKGDSTIIVGQGVGGLLALFAVAAHPEHAAGVMLIDTQMKSPIPVSDQQRDQLLRFIDDNYAQFTLMAFSKMGRDSTESARLYAMMSAVPATTIKGYMRHLLAVDGNRNLKAVRTPFALVFSERLWKPGTSWGTVAKSFGYDDTTGAIPHRIANAGMQVMKDQPDTLAAVVADFATRSFAARKK